MSKRKPEKTKFTSLTIPAEILSDQKLSGVEKHIICDIGYFMSTGRPYQFKYAQIAVKLGVTRRAVLNATVRLKSAGKIIDTGRDEYHHSLHLNCELFSHFGKTDKDKTKESAPPDPAKKFQRPTPEEVTEYAKSIGFDLDGLVFVDYYEARGWMIGKNKMRDWKAAVRTWKNRRNTNGNKANRANRDDSRELCEEYIR